MSLPLPLHPSRVQVLYALRHQPHMKYTELMRATGHESDVFKFHLRILVQNNLVAKNDDKTYSLTDAGKELANNLNDTAGQRDRSPKLSMIIISTAKRNRDDIYLFHQRHRSPFYGYWGFISGPVLWGRSIEDSARHELLKQSGLSAAVRIHGFCRVRDYSTASHALLEDKLFAIVIADTKRTNPHDWRGGVTKWMSWPEFTAESKQFAMTAQVFSYLRQGDTYFEIDNEYNAGMY